MLNKKQIRIAVIAANNIEDIELIVPVDIWKRAGFIVEIIICENRNSFSLHYSGLKLTSQYNLKTINLIQYDAIFLPGGPGWKAFLSPPVTSKEHNESKLHLSIKKFYEEGKWLIGICASPIIFKVLLSEKIEDNEEKSKKNDFTFTAFPDPQLIGNFHDTWINKRFHVDKNIITAQAVGCAYDLAFITIEKLADEELALKIADEIQFPWKIIKKL